jgi:hypothetical protein
MTASIDWFVVDWENSDSAIARSLGRSRKTVALWRRRVDAGAVSAEKRGRRSDLNAISWDAADWSQSHSAIASALGCHVRTVRGQWALRREEASPTEQRTIRPVQRHLPWREVDWSMSDHYISGWTGRCVGAVARMRLSVGRQARPTPRRTADDYGW